MSRQLPVPEVITLSDDDGEITVVAVVPPAISSQGRTFPSQLEPIVISDDDDETSIVGPTPRKVTKISGSALEGSSSAQNNPSVAIRNLSPESLHARLRDQSSSSARVALAAFSPSSLTSNVQNTNEKEAGERRRKTVRRDVAVEKDREPSTSSSFATRRSTLGSAQKRLTSLRIVQDPLNDPVSPTPAPLRSMRLQREELMEVDGYELTAVTTKKKPSDESIVADVVTSTPPFSERRQSSRIRERALAREAPTEEHVGRNPTPVSTSRNTLTPKSNSSKVKSERPAPSTSASSSSQREIIQRVRRNIKKEVDEDIPEHTTSKRAVERRVTGSIKIEPPEMDVDLGENINEAPLLVPSPEAQNSSADEVPVIEPEPTVFYLARDITVPLGLTHVPFHVHLSEQQQKVLRDCQIQIEDQDNFPAGFEMSQRYILSETDSDNVKKEDANNTYDPANAAVLPDFIGPVDDKYVEDNEERMWSEAKVEILLRGDEQRLNQFYEKTHEEYLFCIWKQFEGRIPGEVALQHLMANGYSIEKSLETIETCLERVPQKLRHPSTAQAAQIHRVLWTEDLEAYDYRYIQETILKNYHSSEVVHLFHRFKKFYGFDDGGNQIVPGCNCSAGAHGDVCRKVDFQPRFACANCTKNIRKTQFPPTGLCLICITYRKYANKARPVDNILFDDEDNEKMAEWDKMETQSKKRVNLAVFEKRYRTLQESKHLVLRITKEESLTLDYDKLKNAKSLPVQLTRQLRPFVLPHFSRCQCKNSGWIPVRSANFDKYTFTEDEVNSYRTAILADPGNLRTVADQLDVEVELVERFICAYPRDDPVWNGELEEELIVATRDIRPFEDLPPNLTLKKKDQMKREKPPAIPLE